MGRATDAVDPSRTLAELAILHERRLRVVISRRLSGSVDVDDVFSRLAERAVRYDDEGRYDARDDRGKLALLIVMARSLADNARRDRATGDRHVARSILPAVAPATTSGLGDPSITAVRSSSITELRTILHDTAGPDAELLLDYATGLTSDHLAERHGLSSAGAARQRVRRQLQRLRVPLHEFSDGLAAFLPAPVLAMARRALGTLRVARSPATRWHPSRSDLLAQVGSMGVVAITTVVGVLANSLTWAGGTDVGSSGTVPDRVAVAARASTLLPGASGPGLAQDITAGSVPTTPPRVHSPPPDAGGLANTGVRIGDDDRGTTAGFAVTVPEEVPLVGGEEVWAEHHGHCDDPEHPEHDEALCRAAGVADDALPPTA